MLIGTKLCELRIKAGLSHAELAVRVGVTAFEVGFWERGVLRINAYDLYKIARTLEIDVSEFWSLI